MRPSMNEIEVETKKAARGGGFSWGMAEEVGHAMAMLARSGLDPLPALLELLERDAVGNDVARDVMPALAGQPATAAPLCPISLGVAIVDRVDQLMAGRHIDCGRVFRPILLVPFIAEAAQMIGRPMVLDCGLGISRLHAGWIDRDQFAGMLHADVAPHLHCHVAEAKIESAEWPADAARLDIQSDIWQRLQAFAGRTYVPASDQSRKLGAGAGAIDND